MSDNQNLGFGKFVPGFDFLQNLAKGASQTMPQMPSLANWVAPTLNVEELEKRIGELKAVHFWLDQNSKALGATIQALEVQKMTLATLKGMNFNMSEIANALKLKSADMMAGMQKAAAGNTVAVDADDTGGDDDEPQAATPRKKSARASAAKTDAAPAAHVVDPMQWWGSLTQQFQQIAATAMKDVAAQTAMDTAKHMATGVAKGALKTATGVATGLAKGARKAPAKRAKKKGSA